MTAVYARQSVDKKDSISIETQIDACLAGVGGEYRVYKDKGFSGSNINRPEFERMLGDIKNGIISKVIVYKLDRISRSLLDFSQIIEMFRKHNVEFLSTQEKFDTSSPMGNAMLSITMVFAQLERETIQSRIKDNYYARGKKGFYMGGRAPFGFKKSVTTVDGKKTYILNKTDDEADIVVNMFNQYAYNNKSLGKISKELNDDNIKAPQGGAFDSCKLSRILRNPVYVCADADIFLYYQSRGCVMSNEISDYIAGNGCYLYGKRQGNERKYTDVYGHTVSLALHKGLIDSATFLKCQQKLDENKQIKNSGKGRHTWLSGLTKCGKCGYAMTVTNGYKNIKYLACRGKSNYHICDGHNTVYTVSETEEFIKQQIFRMIEANKGLKYKKKEVDKKTENEYKIKIAGIDRQIDNLISQLADGDSISMKYIKPKIAELDAMKQQLTDELERQKSEAKTEQETMQVIDTINQWETMSIEQKKRVAAIFIKSISLSDNTVSVQWRHSFIKA